MNAIKETRAMHTFKQKECRLCKERKPVCTGVDSPSGFVCERCSYPDKFQAEQEAKNAG